MSFVMSKEEIQIEQISDLKTINISDILLPNGSDKSRALTALFVIYGKNQVMSYVETDRLFEKFKFKVLSRYEIEHNNNINFDSKTKDFLEKGLKAKEERKSLEEQTSYDESLIISSTKKFKKFVPILRYHLDIVSSVLGTNVVYEDLKGFKNTLSIGNVLVHLKSMDEYSTTFELTGLTNAVDFMKGRITIHGEKVTFLLFNNDSMSMYSSFDNNPEGIDSVISIKRNDECIYFNSNREKELIDNPYDSLLSNEQLSSNIKTVRRLPWGAYFGIDENESAYIYDSDDHMMYTSSSETQYIGDYNTIVNISGGREKLEVFKDASISELHFSHIPNALGKYKEYLADKYFYMKVDENDRLIPINDQLKMEYQLFDRSNRKGRV